MNDWRPYDSCPCGCGVRSHKLTKHGHAIWCACKACIGRRNRRKGQRAQRQMHQRLGGTGWTPANEESARPYTLTIMPESKTGDQIPAAWDRFVATAWFRRALEQSRRAAPAGSGARPAVVIRGDWAIVDIRR